MIRLVVEASDDETELLGLRAKNLQSDIEVSDDSISGTLEHVKSYTGFSSVPEEQEGYYLALKITSDDEAVIKTQMVGLEPVKPEVTIDDGFCVYRIRNKDKQRIRIMAEKDGQTVEKEFALSGLKGIDLVRDSQAQKIADSKNQAIEGQANPKL